MVDYSSIFFCNAPFQIVSRSVKQYIDYHQQFWKHIQPFYLKRLFIERLCNLYGDNIIIYNQLIKY